MSTLLTSTTRFTSLDVFRGITVCLMIVVNTPGSENHVFAPLQHAAWHGFTITDLIYPSFLFAVGNSVSFVKEKWSSLTQHYVMFKIIKRSFIIFLIGYLLHWLPYIDENGQYQLVNFSNVRILGILQRIALAYGFASLMIYYLNIRHLVYSVIILLIIYWLLLVLGKDLTIGGNIVRDFDLLVMGPNHMPFRQGIFYETQGWLGTIPAIVNVVAGYIAGMLIRKKGNTYETLALLCLSGFALYIIACVWDFILPINKKLWTGSFVCYTVGLDLLIMAGIIYVIEYLEKTKWIYFFQVFGRNALFIYVIAEIGEHLRKNIIVANGQSVGDWIYFNTMAYKIPQMGSLILATLFMILCWLIGYWLDQKRIYIKV